MRIETDRLIIRSVERGDEMVYADMARDGSLLDVGFDINFAEWMEAWIDEALQKDEVDDPQDDYLAYTICLKSNGAIVGAVGCSYYEDLKQTGITYFIGQQYRRNGYAAESIQAYIKYFFSHYQMKELIATVREENVASWKTIEEASFQLVERKMYQDINDAKEELYRFYVITA
ncbi:MAG: GNAT family N-acetyltransferase [Lachnospiraceae bacterium]